MRYVHVQPRLTWIKSYFFNLNLGSITNWKALQFGKQQFLPEPPVKMVADHSTCVRYSNSPPLFMMWSAFFHINGILMSDIETFALQGFRWPFSISLVENLSRHSSVFLRWSSPIYVRTLAWDVSRLFAASSDWTSRLQAARSFLVPSRIFISRSIFCCMS